MNSFEESPLLFVKDFCKRTASVGRKINELFTLYLKSFPPLSLEQFEFSLYKLNKKVMTELRDDCIAFMKIHGLNSYKKFIKEKQYITGNTWNLLTSKVDGEPPTNKKKNPAVKGSKDSTQPSSESKKSFEEPKKVFYEDKMPFNWVTMTKGQRIDFVSKIQDEGFANYVRSLDPSINRFLQASKKLEENRNRLYINIFSFSSKSTSEEAKNLLKSFVDSLNLLGRASLQYVELLEPPMVEIREVRK